MNCAECGQPLVCTEHEITCSGCGLVYDDLKFDTKIFDPHRENTIDLGTDYSNLRPIVYNSRVLTYHKVNTAKKLLLIRGYDVLKRYALDYNIPKHVVDAIMLDLAHRWEQLRFYSILHIATELYAYNRDQSLPITLEDHVTWFCMHHHRITVRLILQHMWKYHPRSNYNPARTLQNLIRQTLHMLTTHPTVAPRFTPDYVGRIKSTIAMIYRRFEKELLRCKITRATAGAVIFLAIQLHRHKYSFLSKRQFADILQVPEHHIQFQYSKLKRLWA